MFNLDPGKLLIIGVVAILLLGPDRLPQVARQMGNTWKSLNEFRHRMEAEVRSNIPDLPSTSDLAHLARSPSALLNHLGTIASGEDASEMPAERSTRAISDQLPEESQVEGGMNWVTADYSAESPEPAQQEVRAPASDHISPTLTEPARPLESVVVGDAHLN